MDSHTWKLIVDRAIARTASRDIFWVKNNNGPITARSFETTIDESTKLSIWGYSTNFSYELCVTRETADGLFEEKKRVKSKKNADGIRYKDLLDRVLYEVDAIPRDNAFDAVMEYLADPTAKFSTEEKEGLRDRWAGLGYDGFFMYEQFGKILDRVTELTAAGTIVWSTDDDADTAASHTASIGEMLVFYMSARQKNGRAAGVYSYDFSISATDYDFFDVDEQQDPDREGHKNPLWSRANTLHEVILKSKSYDDVAKFNEIVRANIFQDVLAALDAPNGSASS